MEGEKFAGLRADIQIGLTDLHELVKELSELRREMSDVPSSAETRAAAGIVYDFYTNIEKILKRIALELDGGLPAGDDGSAQLLSRAAVSIPHRRPPVLHAPLQNDLVEYLRFRNRYRDSGGHELRWQSFEHLVEHLSSTLKAFREQMQEFDRYLEVG